VSQARKAADELRAQLAAARDSGGKLEQALRKSESDRNDAEELARLADAECKRLSDAAQAAAKQGSAAASAEIARAVEAEQAKARSAVEAERNRFAAIERERDGVKSSLATAEARIATITDLADKQAEQILALEEQLSDARNTIEEVRAGVNASTAGDGPSLEQIEALAESRVSELLQPKLDQLAQVAAFLRTRRERLTALRMGLKRKAKAMKAASGTAGTAGASSNPDIECERAELAKERQEIVDLRAMLHASETAIARRTAGTRFLTSATLCTALLGIAAATCWQVAGVVAPAPVLATVELEVSNRVNDTRVETGTDTAVDAAPIAALIKERVGDPLWGGMVATRLSERGRTRTEADALVANLAERVSVTPEGSTVHIALRGTDELATRTTLDAIATTAVAEANRDTARRSDYLKVGIANAKQEVGRTIFSAAEVLPDPQRLSRAGAMLGITALVGAGLVGILTLIARRPVAHHDLAEPSIAHE
jgi:hypothetical protein